MRVNCDESWIVIQRYIETARVVDLWDQAGVCERYGFAKNKWPGRSVLDSNNLGCTKPLVNPVGIPGIALFVAYSEFAFEVEQYSKVVERVDVTTNRVAERSHGRAFLSRFWQQGRFGIGFLEVFENGLRLAAAEVAILKKRHQHLRVAFSIVILPVLGLARHQRHRHRLVFESLEV